MLPWRQRGRSVLAVLLAATTVLAQVPTTQPTVNRPLGARRLVQEFTFDAREPFALPRHWDLAQDQPDQGSARPGYPRWNKAELDTATAYQSKGSVRLDASGGSTCLRLQPGVIPVFPDAEYLVSAKVLTKGLVNARARLTSRFLDKTNKPIPGTDSRSDLALSSHEGAAGWINLVAPLATGIPEAAYIQIDLEILQPERFQTAELGPHQVWPQDFHAQAWFDDVAVVQLPRVRISTGAPANIVERPARPTIDILVRDLTGETMTGDITVQDARGDTIDRTTRTLDSGLSRLQWTPNLYDLGWYRATLDLRVGDRRVGSTRVDFVWVERAAEGRGGTGVAAARSVQDRDAPRFGLLVSTLPPVHRSLLPEIARLAGAGAVTLPVWDQSLRAAEVTEFAQDLVPLVEHLKSDWRRVSFSLPCIPDELAAATHVEPDRTLALFGADPKLWGPYLDPLLDKFGQGVQRWQVGAPGSAPDPSNTAAPLTSLHQSLARLVPGPVIALPWPAEFAPPAALAGDSRVDLLASVPYAIPAEGLPTLASSWTTTRGASSTLVLQPLPEDQFSRRDAAVELVKSAVSLWSGGGMPQTTGGAASRGSAPHLALVQPWDWPHPGAGSDQLMPRVELAAFRTLSDHLRGRRIAGMLSAPGAICYILSPASDSPGRTGALVAWQSRTDGHARPELASLDAFLGEGPVTLVDIFGNTRPLEPQLKAAGDEPAPSGGVTPAAREQRTHHVALTDEPVFIEGVDVELALFAASFNLQPARLPPTGAEHDAAILLSNPWPTAIEGRISILEPGGLSEDPSKGGRDRSWRITPRVAPFSIAPGQTARIPLSISFSAVEEAGLKDFIAQVDLVGTRSDYGPIRLRTSLEIGLDSSPLDLSYQSSGDDLMLEAQVTNRSGTPATFEVTAYAPGYARMKASISDLAPGQSATRRFALPGGVSKLRGQRVTVGMQDIESRARVNRSITIE